MNQAITYNRNVIIGILLAASFVSLLNQTLLIVAIPSIMGEFGIAPNEAQWVTTVYLLTNGIMIPITAFLIEKFSSRALLITAISIFSLGTFLGAVSPSFSVLLTARIIQAMGAGILMPLMQTVILTIFPPEKRGSAMGIGGLVIGFAPAIGPTLSGWIIDQFAWRYLFYLVLPVTIIVLVAAIFLMKNVTEQKKINVDLISIFLSTFGWGGLLYGFSMVGLVGWSHPSIVGSILVGAVTLVFFIIRQNRLTTPMLNFRVFHSKEFIITTVLSVIMFSLLISIETLLPIFIQDVQGGAAIDSGLALLPGAILAGIMSPVAGRLFDRYGVRELAIIGFFLMFSATLLYINIDLETSIPFIAAIFATKMLGVAFLMTPLMTSGINALPFHLIPHGTAMMNTIRTVGASIGTAMLVSVMSATAHSSEVGVTTMAMLKGIQTAFMVTAVLALIALILAFSLSKKERGKDEQGNEDRSFKTV